MRSSTKLTINGLKTHVHTWGDSQKPILFLVHGFADVGGGFWSLCEILQDHYFCIAPDLRGFGRTDRTPSELGYHFHEYVADLHVLFNHYSKDKPIRLLGHSMGGNVASLYAGAFAERVKSLINIEGFGVVDMPAHAGPDRMRLWVQSIGNSTLKTHYKDIASLAQRLTQMYTRMPKSVAQAWAKELSAANDKGVHTLVDPRHKWPNSYLFRLDQAYSFWGNISAKCLLILAAESEMQHFVGDKKRWVTEMKSRLLRFPKSSKIIELKNCGHMAHLEKPKVVAEHVIDFL